jgi:hypothetical protein
MRAFANYTQWQCNTIFATMLCSNRSWSRWCVSTNMWNRQIVKTPFIESVVVDTLAASGLRRLLSNIRVRLSRHVVSSRDVVASYHVLASCHVVINRVAVQRPPHVLIENVFKVYMFIVRTTAKIKGKGANRNPHSVTGIMFLYWAVAPAKVRQNNLKLNKNEIMLLTLIKMTVSIILIWLS